MVTNPFLMNAHTQTFVHTHILVLTVVRKYRGKMGFPTKAEQTGSDILLQSCDLKHVNQ